MAWGARNGQIPHRSTAPRRSRTIRGASVSGRRRRSRARRHCFKEVARSFASGACCRSTVAMATDPYELTVALDANGAAAGEVFLDDGVSFDFVRCGFARTVFSYANGKLSAAPAHECDARAARSASRRTRRRRLRAGERRRAHRRARPAGVAEGRGRRRPRRRLLLDGRGADDPPAGLAHGGGVGCRLYLTSFICAVKATGRQGFTNAP